MPRPTHRAGALLVPVLLLLAACSAGPSQRPAVAYKDAEQQVAPAPQAPKPAPVPPLGPPAARDLSWEDCTRQTLNRLGSGVATGARFSCTQLLTNLDPPGAPSQGTAQISLLSVGTGAVPLVVVNDAGGEPGTLFAARFAQDLPPEVLKTFTIIGMDRRGTGTSDPADCVPAPDRENIVGFDATATGRPKLDRLLDSVRSSSQECLLDLDDRLQAYDTWRAAADLEQLRKELAVPKLHAFARGEGAKVLTTYGERYPNAVGRMVLDGATDPLLDAVGEAEAQARSAEESFDAFAAQCGADGQCALGPDPRRSLTELIRSHPALPGTHGPITSGHIVRATVLGMSEPDRWPELESALAAAVSGDGTGIDAFTGRLVRGDEVLAPRLDAEMITMCNDTTMRVPPQRSTEIAARWVSDYPLFGGMFAQRLIWCSVWPRPQEPLPVPRTAGLPPIPVVATAHDPMFPALGSQHMAAQLPSGVTMTWLGAGHGAVGRSECITSRLARFLVNGEVPAQGTACPA